LRGRLSALIGRDLGERRDAAETRRDPPLTSVPVPSIEPSDRAIHGADALRVRSSEPEPTPSATRMASSGPTGWLARDGVRKLHAVLHELAECRKLIEGALVRPE